MSYNTTRFGVIDLKEDEAIHFKDGLYGFEQEKLFTILPFDSEPDCPMEWLQSLRTPELAFVITDPFIYVPGYTVRLTSDEEKQIESEPGHSFLVRAIVTVPQDYLEMTANLLAPIVINTDRRCAKQFVLTGTEFDTRHYLLSREFRKAEVSASD